MTVSEPTPLERSVASPLGDANPSSSGPIGNYRWVICTLLFFATTINYIDRQILALLKPILDDQLHWTSTQYGAINSAFQGAYAIGLFIFGWLVDRYGTKAGYAISIAAWSLAAAAHALAFSIPTFTLMRVLLGLGEGGNFPSSIKATALWFPQRQRALATSFFNSGANVGALIAPAVVPALAFHYGWHAPFVVAGIAGFIWLGFWFALYQTPDKSRFTNDGERAFARDISIENTAAMEDDASPVSWQSLLKSRRAWSFIIAKMLTDPVWWFFLIWLPDFFKQSRHLDIKSSWPHLVAIYGTVTVLSVFGGWVPGILIRRGWTVTKARKVCMFVFALLVIPIVFVTHVNDWTAVALIGLAGSAHQAWSANLYTTVSDMFPKRVVASLTGLGGTFGSIGGMAFPIFTGWLLDKAKTHDGVSAGYAILFGICGCAYLVAFAIQHLLAPTFDRAPENGPRGFEV